MSDYRIIEVKQSVFADNNADAAKLRNELKEEGTWHLKDYPKNYKAHSRT